METKKSYTKLNDVVLSDNLIKRVSEYQNEMTSTLELNRRIVLEAIAFIMKISFDLEDEERDEAARTACNLATTLEILKDFEIPKEYYEQEAQQNN